MPRRETRLRKRTRTNRSQNENEFLKRISSVDPSDLKSDYDQWPELASRSAKNQSDASKTRSYSRVIMAGMGGSGITGEVIVDYSHERKSTVCFETLKDYHLPQYAGPETLVIGMSSSGNTEETLSVLSEAHARGLDAWTFGSGGLVEKLSYEKWNFSYTKTEMLKVPRSSFPGLFFFVLTALQKSGTLSFERNDLKESLEVLQTVRNECTQIRSSNRSLALARELASPDRSSAVIYSSNRTRAAGLRARQSINENAKIHLYDGVSPELCHNDVVAWDVRNASVKGASDAKHRQKLGSALLLRLDDDPVEIGTRFEIVEQIIRSNGGRVLEAPYLGKSYLARILSMIYFLDYCSYFLAIIRGVDPIKTPSIDRLKTELGTKLNYSSRIR